MTELRYGKGRLFWLLLAGIGLTVGAGWLAVSHPAPDHGGRYARLYDLIGPFGIELLFGASCLFFAAGCVAVAAMLVGPGVAAAITPDGLVVRQWWGDLHLPWRELRGFEDKRVRAQGREHRWLVIRFAPRKVGPFTRGQTSLSYGNLRADEGDIDAWVEAALAAAADAAAAAPPTPPTRGFGRRGLAGQPTSA